MSNDGVVLYFPLGEPQDSTTAGNIAPGRSDVLTVTQYGTGGTVTFGTGTGPGTDDLSTPTFAPVDVNNGKYLAAALSTPVTVTGDHHLELECFFTATAGGSVAELVIGMGDDVNNLGLLLGLATTGQPFAAFNVPGTPIYGSGAAIGATSVRDGQLHHGVVRVALTDPGTVTMSLIVDGVVTTGTPQAWPYTSGGVAFFPGMIRLFAGGGPSGAMFTGTIAHVAVFTQQTTTLATSRFDAHRLAGTTGFAGESSGARIQRYARYAGIPAAEVSVETGLSTSIAHKDTTGELPINLMQAVAETEDGVLFDGKDGTLTFHSRSHRYGATSAFTLSVAAGDVEAGLVPKLDDQHLTNDMTASRPNGVTIRSTNATSITEYGYYRETLEVLTTSDNEVQARADWEVNRFGTPRVSVPNIAVDLTTCSSSLQAALLAADIGTKFTVTGLPSQAPASTMDFFIEGISERIGTQSYGIEFNVSAAAYANVFTLDSPTLAQLDSTATLAY